jgi:hypothetical protein
MKYLASPTRALKARTRRKLSSPEPCRSSCVGAHQPDGIYGDRRHRAPESGPDHPGSGRCGRCCGLCCAVEQALGRNCH